MIHWLLQSLDDCPQLVQGQPPAGLLDTEEQKRLASFTVEKRRRDWLLGRWTAKHLMQRYLADTASLSVALADLHIGNHADGSPYVSFRNTPTADDTAAGLPVSLTISHSHGYAFCAVCAEQAVAEDGYQQLMLGCDLELIEPREHSFVNDFFTAEEIRSIADASANQLTMQRLVTATWSAKEAVLKALRTGLRIDTRRIACNFSEPNLAPADWTPFTVALDARLHSEFPGTWSAWWRVHAPFVLTLAVRQAI